MNGVSVRYAPRLARADPARVHALAQQHRQDGRHAGLAQRDGASDQVPRGLDARIAAGHEDLGRVLEDRSQHDHRAAARAVQQQARLGEPVVRPPRHHLRGEVRARRAFDEPDVEAGLPVVALGDRGVVAGELELVPPLQLDGHGAQGKGRRRRVGPRARREDRRRSQEQEAAAAPAAGRARVGP